MLVVDETPSSPLFFARSRRPEGVITTWLSDQGSYYCLILPLWSVRALCCKLFPQDRTLSFLVAQQQETRYMLDNIKDPTEEKELMAWHEGKELVFMKSTHISLCPFFR